MTTYPTGIDKAFLGGIDAILGIRDAVGAIIQPVYLVTRTWYTDQALTTPNTLPEGYAKDSTAQVLPSPKTKDFSQDIRVKEGGAIKAGDMLISGISKNKYQSSDLDGTTAAQNVQKFYMIGVKLYQVIDIVEKHVTFNVQVRELTNQARF